MWFIKSRSHLRAGCVVAHLLERERAAYYVAGEGVDVRLEGHEIAEGLHVQDQSRLAARFDAAACEYGRRHWVAATPDSSRGTLGWYLMSISRENATIYT